MQENLPQSSGSPDRWTLLRDASVLQFKLIVDGMRDLILVPTSIIAALISLANSEDGKPGPHFYRLLGLGKRSERWIDLFGAYRHAPEGVKEEAGTRDMSIDDIVNRMETFVVDEYKRGGVTKQAKERLDKALDTLQRARNRQP